MSKPKTANRTDWIYEIAELTRLQTCKLSIEGIAAFLAGASQDDLLQALVPWPSSIGDLQPGQFVWRMRLPFTRDVVPVLLDLRAFACVGGSAVGQQAALAECTGAKLGACQACGLGLFRSPAGSPASQAPADLRPIDAQSPQ